MFDVFAGDKQNEMKRKFNLSTYISPKMQQNLKKNTLGSNGIDPQDSIALNRALADIEANVNKSLSEYDRITMQLKDKSKVINTYLKENGDLIKGEVVVLFHKADIDLLNAQLNVIDRKIKASLDKAKAIRDEKKLYFDKQPKVVQAEAAQPQTAAMPNQPAANPLALVSYDSQPQVITGRVQQDYNPQNTAVVTPTQPIQTPEVDPKNNNASISVTPQITTPSSKPLSYDANGNVIYTTADLQNQSQSLINDRIAHLDEDPNFATGIGANYAQTLAKVRQDSANVEYELFVSPKEGKYYLKGFTTDATGGKHEYSDTVPLGLDVLGKIKFNPYKPIATPEFYKNQLKVNVVDSTSDMPEFYQNEWNSPAAKNFLIESESDISILSHYKEK